MLLWSTVVLFSVFQLPVLAQESDSTQLPPEAAVALSAADYFTGPSQSHAPVVRVYRYSLPWFGENRDYYTLLSMGKIVGDDLFLHPLSDLSTGIPPNTAVVHIASNGYGYSTAVSQQNAAAAQANLASFVQAGGVLIVDMGDNAQSGGFIAPGSTGTPSYILPGQSQSAVSRNATLTSAAMGSDGILGTDDDHLLVIGADGVAGTTDDLNQSNIDLAYSSWIAHGNLQDGISISANSTVLMTVRFGAIDKPILAEYPFGGGLVILDTITKEWQGHKGPQGTGYNKPTYFMANLFNRAMKFRSPLSGPSADAGPDLVVECDSLGGTIITLDGTASTDPDGVLDIVLYEWLEGTLLLGTGPNLMTLLSLGSHIITLAVTDTADFSDSDTVMVDVIDTTAPTLTAPSSLTIECSAQSFQPVNLGSATATDNCDPNPAVFNNAPASYGLGVTIVTWTATDASGNSSAEKTQMVTISDLVPPDLTAPPDLTIECSDPGGQSVDIGSATATDICDSNPAVTRDAPETYSLGDTIVTWSATDASGNSSTVTQTVTIVDTTPPVVTCALVRIGDGDGDKEGESWHHDEDEGDFKVVVSVTDVCDSAPEIEMVMIARGPGGNECGTVAVTAGQEMELEMEDDDCEIEVEEDSGELELEIEAVEIILRVTATDASGNVTVCEATPQGLALDNDDDSDPEDDDD
jgi:hypothetical protein